MTVVNVVEDVTAVLIVDQKGDPVPVNPLVVTVLHTEVTLNDGQGERIDRTDVTYKWQRNGAAVGQPDT